MSEEHKTIGDMRREVKDKLEEIEERANWLLPPLRINGFQFTVDEDDDPLLQCYPFDSDRPEGYDFDKGRKLSEVHMCQETLDEISEWIEKYKAYRKECE